MGDTGFLVCAILDANLTEPATACIDHDLRSPKLESYSLTLGPHSKLSTS